MHVLLRLDVKDGKSNKMFGITNTVIVPEGICFVKGMKVGLSLPEFGRPDIPTTVAISDVIFIINENFLRIDLEDYTPEEDYGSFKQRMLGSTGWKLYKQFGD